MFKKFLRGSLFLSFMLIISVTLTGCNIDIGKIVSGLTNTLGSIVSGVGKIIKSGVEVVKKVVDTAKPVVTSVANAIGEFTGKTDAVASKIDSGLNKVDSALNKASNLGQKIENAGEKLKASAQDSAGNKLSSTAPTTQTTASSKRDSDVQLNSSKPINLGSPNTVVQNNPQISSETKITSKFEDFATTVNNALKQDTTKEQVKSNNTKTVNFGLLTKKEQEPIKKSHL